MAAPEAAAASVATSVLPVLAPIAMATNAPISIMPSSAMFRTLACWLNMPPRPASRSGTVCSTIANRKASE